MTLFVGPTDPVELMLVSLPTISNLQADMVGPVWDHRWHGAWDWEGGVGGAARVHFGCALFEDGYLQ